MDKLKLSVLFFLTLILAYGSPGWAGTTGKIAGTVVDKETGQPLIGANIIIEGTSLGAATDVNGHYTILEVPPGTYKLKVSYIGYRNTIISHVIVNIDQTARVDISLELEAVNMGELVVVAKRRLIKPDVATSVVAITSSQIHELPVTNVAGALSLQAGVSGGGNYVNIRGGGPEGILVQVNGVTLRDPRDESVDLQLPLSSLKEISVSRGGFNAEYGQVQSGIINVVTRQGNKDSYSGRLQVRVNPPQRKYWLAPGIHDLNNPMSYALRPFFDPAVCWTGTGNGAWDYYTRSKYPNFQGWDAVSTQLNAQGINLTPAAAQRAFEYEIRKKQPNNQPDFDIDAGFGGPVPLVSEALGNLRFYASYKSTRTMLIWPLSRPDYRFNEGTFQLNSDITPTMKLQFYALYGDELTEKANWNTSSLETPIDVLSNALQVTQATDLMNLYSNFVFVPANIRHNHFSLKFTNTISPTTYYEVSLQNTHYNYDVSPGPLRDTTQKIEVVPGFYEDSNPIGYWPFTSNGVILNSGQNMARKRDHSVVNSSEIKADLVSQVNFENLVKCGISFDYNDLNFDYGTIQSATAGDVYASRTQMHVFPYRGAVYLQDKLEAKEFTLNAGLRLDYADANVHWYDINPFNSSFFSTTYNPNEKFPTSRTKMQWFLSPRLGIAHPITENAKLFFNYGWFRELPQYESIFWLNRSNLNAVTYIGNPNVTMQRTISYELGVDYSFSNEYLLQIAGYYKDATNEQYATTQESNITYYATAAGFSYQTISSSNYGDHRGAEFTLRKTSGRWWRGFINYTYDVGSSGHFGPQHIYDNVSDQNSYDQSTKNLYQDRPIPSPYARANLNFFTPNDFGPKFFNQHLLGDWMLNVVVDWKAGQWQTWNPNGQLNIAYNVQAVDYFNTNLRLQKTFSVGELGLSFFMDVNNVFDTRYLADAASNPWFLAGNVDYMRSLHLPQSNAYDNITGNDKIGDYRKPGIPWQPIEKQSQITATSTAPPPDKMNGNNSIAIYYSVISKDYWWYRNGAWTKVPKADMDKVLSDKAYINMPNQSTFWFLNPRQIFFGLTVTFNFD